MTSETPTLDRRQRRRLETIEEVLDVALEVMAEQGVAGLSIGEVARRMGIRPPSLYVYFESKNALYDALFERGARLILGAIRDANERIFARDHDRLEDYLLPAGRAFARWAVENPMYSQLLFWRPVPGFTPSADAYAPAVELVALSHERFADLQHRGLIRADARVEHVQRDWTIALAGVVSQQLSNAPDEPFDKGTFTSALPDIVAMFVRHYEAGPRETAPTQRRGRRADKR